MNENIDESNFVLYCAKHYDNPQCFDTIEFNEDINRFKYIKRLFNRYQETGDLKERLIINHLIILYNCFGDIATRLLFYKLDGYYNLLKPFLVLLGRMPESIKGVKGKVILSSDIHMDMHIVNTLRKI